MDGDDLRLAVYLRISNRERALHGYGLDVQKDKIINCLDLYEVNYSSIKLYVDDGYSAKNMDRPEMNKLIEDIKSNQIDVVYIYKLDRLARNVIDTYKFIDMLIRYQCSLVAVLDRIDIQTANGRLLVGVLAILAQWELETITERTADGIAQMVEQGKYPYGRLPFGYRRHSKTKFLYIFEPEAKIVRKIFDFACGGITIKEIQKILFDEGIDLTTDQIKNILLKKHYCGEFEFKGKIYTNIVPAIISKETYYTANKIVKKKFKNYGGNVYWFSNKVQCKCGEICNRVVTIKNKVDKYYYYYCPVCKKRINQNKLAEYVVREIDDHTIDIKINKNKKDILNKIKAINEKIEKFHRQYLNDKIDFSVYVSALKEFEEEKIKLNAKETAMRNDVIFRWNKMTDIEKKSYIDLNVKRLVIDIENKCVSEIIFIENN